MTSFISIQEYIRDIWDIENANSARATIVYNKEI